MTVVLAALLLLVSCAIALAVLGLLLNALNIRPAAAIERRRFRRAQQRCRRGDDCLEQGDIDGALREFTGAFFLDPIITDPSVLSEVHNHHTALLSRFIAVTEDVQGGTVRLMALAKADRLLTERIDLQRRHLTLRSKRASREAIPDLYRRLRANRKELTACLQQLSAEIAASQPVAGYH